MEINLPTAYLKEMKEILGERFPLLLDAYAFEPLMAMRINDLKISPAHFREMSPWPLQQVAWCPSGFYYDKKDKPGLHPFHEAGLYYIQEASAMKAVEALEVKPGELVLDLCAAPGGKATQIAAKLEGKGLLVANELVNSRAVALIQNLERLGVRNSLVLSERPEKLAAELSGFFDKILIDAPCSGSGMFRKNPKVIDQYHDNQPQRCAKQQKKILSSAAVLLKGGGRLVYSTCSFSKIENEEVIDWFLTEHPEYELLKQEKLWPFEIAGEGHFVAALKKKGESRATNVPKRTTDKKKTKIINDWLAANRIDFSLDIIRVLDNRIIMINDRFPELKKLKVLSCGLALGTMKGETFIPHHWLAKALPGQLDLTENQLREYLRGEELTGNQTNRWLTVGIKGYSLGWVKVTNGKLKNHFPKGLWQR